MRQYVIDGNFTAQHMKMNKPELDVALSDGKGFMVAEVPYQSHLKQSLDSKEASVYRSWSLFTDQSVRDPPAAITGLSMLQTSTSPTYDLQGLVLLLVLGMAALSPTQW